MGWGRAWGSRDAREHMGCTTCTGYRMLSRCMGPVVPLHGTHHSPDAGLGGGIQVEGVHGLGSSIAVLNMSTDGRHAGLKKEGKGSRMWHASALLAAAAWRRLRDQLPKPVVPRLCRALLGVRRSVIAHRSRQAACSLRCESAQACDGECSTGPRLPAHHACASRAVDRSTSVGGGAVAVAQRAENGGLPVGRRRRRSRGGDAQGQDQQLHGAGDGGNANWGRTGGLSGQTGGFDTCAEHGGAMAQFGMADAISSATLAAPRLASD